MSQPSHADTIAPKVPAQQDKAAAAPPPTLHPSPGLAAWLQSQGGSLVFTTYQSARIFFVSALEQPDGSLGTVALERIVGSAMGLAIDRDKLWVTNKEQAWRFTNIGPRTLKPASDQDPVAFDAVYMPRWGILLGGCDTHDVLANIGFNGRQHELLFVNTAFSCIASIDGHFNFVPVWKPSFISALSPEDRCHLNGMGAKDGQLAYATACAETDAGYAWKPQKNGGGLLMDVQANEIITRNLSMPHSPRWHDGKVWLLNSGDGQLGYVDPANGQFTPVADCPGFARGLHIVGDHAIVGLSKLRDNTFSSGLRIKQKLEDAHIPQRCGLLVISLKTGKVEHWLSIEGAITELYDVAFLPGIQRPYTPGFGQPELHRHAFNVPSDLAPVAPPTPVRHDGEAEGTGAQATEAAEAADHAEPAKDTKA